MKIKNPKGAARAVITDDDTNRSYPFEFERLYKWVMDPNRKGNFDFRERSDTISVKNTKNMYEDD